MSADLIGRTLAHFRIVEKLGQGGMGVVYKAMDDKLLRPVALKVLSPKHVGSEERRRRFLTEAQSAAAVTHANIATVYEVGEAEGLVFIAMELVEGQTLRKLLERGALPISDALTIGRRIARALAKAHERGIVHRDLKPDNVMIGEDLDVKVLDFGLAKLRQSPDGEQDAQLAAADTLVRLTQEGSVLGTPGYMSPEQAGGTALDHRTDIFSLGVILYEMVTGVRPFQGRSPMEVIIAISRDGYEPAWRLNPAVPQDLDAIINICLAKHPDDRYGSARELQRDLERLRGDTGSQLSMSQVSLHELNVGAVAASTASRRFPSVPGLVTTQRRRRPRRWLSGWAVAAVLLIGISIGAIRRLAPSARKPVSDDPEAAALYETALQDWRRGLVSACSKLAQAAEKDPRLGAAHLRFAICESVGTPSLARQSFQRAEQLRPSLSERDRQLLDAYEPVFQRQPSDFPETQRRLRALAARYPKDAEIAWWMGDVATQLVDFQQAVEAYDQALELDPSLVSAWRYRAQMLAYLGDFDGALQSIARCLDVSPGATACLRERITINEERGDCAAVEADARRWLTVEPDLQLPYRLLAEGLMGQGRHLETVREALKQKWNAPVPAGSNGPVLALQDAQRIDILAGRLAAAVEGAERELELISSSKWEVDHARPAARLVALYEEIGKPGEALRVAESFLARRDAWESDPRGDDWAISKDPTATMLGVLRRAGAVSKEKVDALRAARLAWWQPKAAPNTRNFLWIHQYAKGVETEEAAKEALAVLPQYEPLPPYKPEIPADAHIGRTFLLGGRVDEALPYLERMMRSCYALQHPIEHTRSAYFLGLAREAKGDRAGACTAYAVVHERWGNAQPKSVTGKKASERMKALGCR